VRKQFALRSEGPLEGENRKEGTSNAVRGGGSRRKNEMRG